MPVLNNVRYASDSDHSRYEFELTLWANSGHEVLLDFRSCSHQISVVGPHCSRPAYARHFAQVLRLSPLIGLEALGNA